MRGGFLALALLAFSAGAAPIAASADLDGPPAFLITAVWPDRDPADVDLIVQDPRDGIVWYRARETEVLRLDRDDRGNFRDPEPLNQEIVSVRGGLPGEYVVNVSQYALTDVEEPLPVFVRVQAISPVALTVYEKTVEMRRVYEVTVVRFVLDDAGRITSFTFEDKPLAAAARTKVGLR